MRLSVILSIFCLAFTSALHADDKLTFFENQVRPLLVNRCSECHGAKKQEGGLRVDSFASLTSDRGRGPAVTPSATESSLLVKAIRGNGDLAMPPYDSLSDSEIQILLRWIEIGAPWPKTEPDPSQSKAKAKDHWAFQKVSEPALPTMRQTDWIRSPMDAFVLTKLQEAGLEPSSEAPRDALIRRASYALTGLPPSTGQVEEFVDDPDPLAYERLVDRLLASPAYGEHWARRWLDVARYSDTKGYVYAREERTWTHAWRYRDWVVEALNTDLPYNRFLLLQIAADQVDDRRRDDLAAMGFLTLGRRFLGVKRDIIDDRIDVVCRGTMALTVGCARCHDHKYDPIPTADYYSLYGVFDSCAERLVALEESRPDEAFWKELHARRETLNARLSAARQEASDRARSRVADYLHAQTELNKYPADGFDQVFQKSDLLPRFVRRWEAYLRDKRKEDDPVFAVWHAFADIPAADFGRQARKVTKGLSNLAGGAANPLVLEAFQKPPESFVEVTRRYGDVFADVQANWKAAIEKAAEANQPPPKRLQDHAKEQLRQTLYGPDSPCHVPDLPIVHTETYFDSATTTELWKLQGEVDRWINQSQPGVPFALTLVDRPSPVEPRVFHRGNPLRKGEEVPRQFLSVIAGEDRSPFENGSGRLELAQAIVDENNPLTARVIVNRVWAHHFGEGLVGTPSDFGMRAGLPSHPKLLDWLAVRLVEGGWSLKKLHRDILLSATFRQSSLGPEDDEIRQRALKADPDNRLLWRVTPRRLSFEEFRDSMLSAAELLDRRMGGKPDDLFTQPFAQRRTIYGRVDRQFLPSILRTFDFANPDLHVAERNETTAPQQALFFMNHPFVLKQTKSVVRLCENRIAQHASAASADEELIRALFRRIVRRGPSERELRESLALISAPEPPQSSQPSTAADWQYGFGAFDEAAERVMGFTPLPHFSGDAWRGGPKYPDVKLGWVQLSAEGGHPGNDRQHASVRRWTAPRSMTVSIQSKLIHDAKPGDGIRAFVVSSRQGLLQSASVHQQTASLDSASLNVTEGETIDFVVDIGDVLNSDQYLWTAAVTEKAETAPVTWDSKADFVGPATGRLTALQQLAQVLFWTNEFLFVD